ncbi:hypothetical protein [Fibrobacter sp. UWH4]|uniref:hypothetical protein n=1 Tax=Fibrobacter sp. UWH4 TaxID=1896210 RepID=UPI0009144B62|nr:hypothetical protein [Fibrobacter sp. UWH4]SHL83332.1 hypothetical protein SAMN05720762_1178 [Fibrobacter sp. UWH4]
MNSTYAQKSSTVQKAADTKAASVLDSSAQSESLQRKADLINDVTLHGGTLQCFTVSATLRTSLLKYGVPKNLIGAIEANQGIAAEDRNYGWTRFTYNGNRVYHVTNGAEGVTVFYCKDATGNAEVLGIGFHNDEKKYEKKYGTPLYKLDKFVCKRAQWVGLKDGTLYSGKKKNDVIKWDDV